MTCQFELMRPEELIKLRDANLPVYLPIGSVEWHSYHMGLGVDTLHAREVSARIVKETGGAVFPPVFIGTEDYRDRDSLQRLGFCGDERILGMDFPDNTVISQYWPKELFYQIVETQVRLILSMGFSKIVLVNGHGSEAQKTLLEKISTLYSDETNKVITVFAMVKECEYGLGHAGLAETSLMMAICPEMVDISKLPPKPKQLICKKYGIADAGAVNHDGVVRFDPRDATSEIGEAILKKETQVLAGIIKERMGIR